MSSPETPGRRSSLALKLLGCMVVTTTCATAPCRIESDSPVVIEAALPVPPPASPEPRTTTLSLPVTEPARAPAPRLFEGRETVSYGELLDELRKVASRLEASPVVRDGYERLCHEYQLTPEELPLESYSRVRLVFEAARDGGLWGIRWTITDRMPWSDHIWRQWRSVDFSQDPPEVTASAECDELSAMFAFLARDLGVVGIVALFWPAWNHTVAVWELRRAPHGGKGGERVRILVPTSQVWLSRGATLGTREFKTNQPVFAYRRKDLRLDTELGVGLVRYLIGQLEQHGGRSNEELLERRNRLGGS
ncbi:MAG: hypothetical protein JW940_04125 [Polyangiaceae bacterium]|nr:hypothetical protein [Polyangiaceae bacterium]